jgi:hypothetical protein
MTVTGERGALDDRSSQVAEALIEEARRRHRRRLVTIVAVVLLVAAGGLSYALVGNSGSTKPPLLTGSTPGIAPSASAPSRVPAPERALLVSCALDGLSPPMTSVPANASFTLFKSGISGSTPWSFWVSTTDRSAPIFAGIAGSGSSAVCISPGSWGGGQEFAQLPGQPVAFLFGYTPAQIVVVKGGGQLRQAALRLRNEPAPVREAALTKLRKTLHLRSVRLPVTRMTVVFNGIHASITPRPLGATSYRSLFAEVTGLRCASTASATTGIYESATLYAGSDQVSSSLGIVVGDGLNLPSGSAAKEAVVNSRSTLVSCGGILQPLENVASDLVPAPRQLRLAAMRTIDARSLLVSATAEHPLSARTWVTQVSTYSAPDRFAGPPPGGPYLTSPCGSEKGYARELVVIGATIYDVQQNCLAGRVLPSAPYGPTLERHSITGCYGLTAAQLLAFGDLLVQLHAGSHFQPVDSGYSFTAGLVAGVGAGSCSANNVGNKASVTGTITLAHGYVTSVTTTWLFPGCSPPGLSCHGTTTTKYTDFNSAPSVQVPNAKNS